MTQPNQQSLWAAYAADRSDENRNRLAESYFPWLVRLANVRYRRSGGKTDLGDLIGYGSNGLLAAIERYQPERGTTFQAYARRPIIGAMVDGIRQMDWAPRSVRLAEKHGGPEARKLVRLPFSVTAKRAGVGRGSEARDSFRALVRTLDRDCRTMLHLLYVDGLTMAETARAIGICPSRISQLHKQALEALKPSAIESECAACP